MTCNLMDLCHVFSVSSVKTLQDAKVMKDCWYMSMPVQAVSFSMNLGFQATNNRNHACFSIPRCNLASSKRFTRLVIVQLRSCLKSGRQLTNFLPDLKRVLKDQMRRRRKVAA